ncbi:hypothetical protein ACIBEJ_40725 [Nonomuraea sp. NPDC050790]|uniref:hypothetical protein n=1 Tax=Nonomuraea sp. NPDC050790 TaxID=3364371 RepID=UPI0037BDC5A5
MTHNEDYRPPERSPEGKPMASATPRDVVHVRVGSFILFFAIAVGVVGLLADIPLLAVVAGVVAVATIVDIILAVRGQRARGSGEAG